ncbi:MAG: glycosyltransferase family 4 protein, partial [Ignavibacteria bacterium]|nr:glycosyltransferase family 4 protein [Ignavibacteria bacterium]
IEKNPLKRKFIKIESERILQYEKNAEYFDRVFICSTVDKEHLIKNYINADIKILNNGVDIEYFHTDSMAYESNRIIFTGNMPYFPNYDAVFYFSQEIFPIILKEIPDAKFLIVGQKPPRAILKLQSENIIVTGFVEDIKSEYIKSAVNIAPMRFGAGTLNKVIESLALGVPVVATEIAIAGLPKELQKFVFIANDKHDFAEKVISVMNNPEIRNRIFTEARQAVREIISWEKVVSNLEQELLLTIKEKNDKL